MSFSFSFWAYLGRGRIRTDHVLHVDVDVVRTGADCERLFLHIFAVFVAQLVEQFHVLMGFEVRVPGEKEKKIFR